MRLCDTNWNDPSGGHSIETWDSNQKTCLAIRIENRRDNGHTATLTADDCAALGMHLLMHAKKNGIDIMSLLREADS